MVQGVIDVLFEEEDGFTLVDYKTDYAREDNIQQLVETYQIQLDLYARAVEKILRQKVKEKILYSFTLGRAISIP